MDARGESSGAIRRRPERSRHVRCPLLDAPPCHGVLRRDLANVGVVPLIRPPICFQVASGGPFGTRMRVRVVVYAWRFAVNLAVRYSPRWIGPEIVPFASVPAKMNVIEL